MIALQCVGLCCPTVRVSYVSKSLSRVWLLVTHGLQPARCLCPCASPGKSTGVGCRFLFQGIVQPRGRTQVAHIAGGVFTIWAPGDQLYYRYTCTSSLLSRPPTTSFRQGVWGGSVLAEDPWTSYLGCYFFTKLLIYLIPLQSSLEVNPWLRNQWSQVAIITFSLAEERSKAPRGWVMGPDGTSGTGIEHGAVL